MHRKQIGIELLWIWKAASYSICICSADQEGLEDGGRSLEALKNLKRLKSG